MKRSITLIFFFQITISMNTFSQEYSGPIVVSPFIGENLDRVEKEYFELFPGINDFQEAIWYYNSDSVLIVNIKYRINNELIDTTRQSIYSLSKLEKRINGVIINNIRDREIEALEITTSDSVYEGLVFTEKNNRITLIDYLAKNDISTSNEIPIYQFHTSEIKKVKIYESSFLTTLLSTCVGIIGFGAIGSSVAPEETVQESHVRTVYTFPNNVHYEEYYETKIEKDRSYIPYFAITGVIVGYLVGQSFKFPNEYFINDPDAKEVIKENSLLPNGIK